MAAPFCRWPGMAGASRSGRTALRREGCSFRSQQSVPRLLSGHAVGGTRLCGMGHIRRRTAMRRHHIVGSPCRMQCHAACVLQAWFTLSEDVVGPQPLPVRCGEAGGTPRLLPPGGFPDIHAEIQLVGSEPVFLPALHGGSSRYPRKSSTSRRCSTASTAPS